MVKGRTLLADTGRMGFLLDLRDDPRRARRVFGALFALAVALTVLVATGALDERDHQRPVRVEEGPRTFV